MTKLFDYLNRYAFFRALPDRAKLAVLCSIVVFLWIVSGVILPSGPAREIPDTIAERNRNSDNLVVQTRPFSPSFKTQKIILRGSTEADRAVQLAAQTSGTIIDIPAEKGNAVKAGDIICQIDIDARQAQLEEAEALMRAREIDYKAAQTLVEKGHFSLSRAAAAKAAYDTAVALHKQRKVELERTHIRAPFDGIFDTQPLEIGDFISIGQSCGTLIDKDPLLVVAQISEKQISALEAGAKASVSLVTGEEIEGKLTYIAEKADPRTRTFMIEVELPNADNQLRDGVSAEVTLTGKQREAHLIPHGIISLNTDGRIGVNTVVNGTVKFVPVEVMSDDLTGLFVQGLEGKVDIIVVGQNFVKDGQLVKVDKLDPLPELASQN